MLVAIYPACKFLGVVGGQVAALAAIGAGYLLQTLRMRGLTGLDVIRYAKAFGPSAVVCLGIIGGGFALRSLGLAKGPAVQIALAICACLLAYGVCLPGVLRSNQDRPSN